LRAIQNFSPALERWVLDEEAGEVTYGIVNCAGQTKSEGVATLERVDGGDGAAFEATWSGKSPLENVAAESIRVEITEDTLKNFADVATSRTDIEASNFASMCAEVGETAASFAARESPQGRSQICSGTFSARAGSDVTREQWCRGRFRPPLRGACLRPEGTIEGLVADVPKLRHDEA